MNFGVIAATLSLGLTVALASTASDFVCDGKCGPLNAAGSGELRGTSGGATTNNLQGIGLTASHKRIIYDNIASEQAQTLSGDLSLQLEAPFPTRSCSILCRLR